MLGLADEVHGNHVRIGIFAGNYQDFGRASKQINTDLTKQHSFRLGNESVAGADQDISLVSRKQSECHGGDTLYTT